MKKQKLSQKNSLYKPIKENAEYSFLDKNIIAKFRRIIISSDIFNKSERLKKKYNLICVVMDRLDTCVEFLNKHENSPESEEEFICFLVYACMVIDAISHLYESIYQKKPDYVDEKKYFKDVMVYSRSAFTNETCPTDDAFFEYLRSMAFAHPYNTSYRKARPFFENGEQQYCPWVIAIDDLVGIRVYTSSDKFAIQDLTFPFETLKEYIKSRYVHLNQFVEWAEEEILEQDKKWSEHKVDRSGSIEDIIKSIKEIYVERFLELYDIETIETHLMCNITNSSNRENVEIFRKELVECIYRICDALDEMNYDALQTATDILYVRPNFAYLHYQLEKINCYLNDYSEPYNIRWGLTQAESFSSGFAKKWVVIDTQSMSFDEIKLLVSVACYLEAKEQEETKNSE